MTAIEELTELAQDLETCRAWRAADRVYGLIEMLEDGTMKQLTREQAIDELGRGGADILDELDEINAAKVGDSEWRADMLVDRMDTTISAHYILTDEQITALEAADGDDAAIDWTVSYYTID